MVKCWMYCSRLSPQLVYCPGQPHTFKRFMGKWKWHDNVMNNSQGWQSAVVNVCLQAFKKPFECSSLSWLDTMKWDQQVWVRCHRPCYDYMGTRQCVNRTQMPGRPLRRYPLRQGTTLGIEVELLIDCVMQCNPWLEINGIVEPWLRPFSRWPKLDTNSPSLR